MAQLVGTCCKHENPQIKIPQSPYTQKLDLHCMLVTQPWAAEGVGGWGILEIYLQGEPK